MADQHVHSPPGKHLRSRRWFDDPADPAMTALYLERYMNYGITPEAAVGGGLALLRTGDRIRIDLDKNKVDVLLAEGELDARRAAWTPPKLLHMTPWEEIYRSMVGQQGSGACLEPATLYLNILETRGESRNNH